MKEAIEGYEVYTPTHTNGDPKNYGLFGYESHTINSILTRDDAPALKKAIDFGWINTDSETLYQQSMIEYAELRGAEKCKVMLLENGFK